jgi:hypothetical protein
MGAGDSIAEPGQPRSRAEAWAAELDAARRRAWLVLPDWLGAPAEQLRRQLLQWVLAELAPGRLVPGRCAETENVLNRLSPARPAPSGPGRLVQANRQ